MAFGIALSAAALVIPIEGFLIPAIIIGMSITSGCFGPISGAFIARYYGVSHIGAISGVFMSSMIVSSATGPLLFSFCKDYTGSYNAAFIATLYAAIVLVIASFWADNPQRKLKREMEAG